MNRRIRHPFPVLPLFLLSVILLFTCYQARSQEDAEEAIGSIENYKEQVRRLVGFLEFSLNTLGSDETTTREKEVLINDSYVKAFRDSDVQIEDDLDDRREVVTYKDVQAYLKDVDFFFEEVEFDYTVQEVLPQFTESGDLFFKVTANRNIKGITVEGDTMKNDMLRYIEMNLDEAEQVLKIVSIYTTKLNEKAEIKAWWLSLNNKWKQILGSDIYLFDSVSIAEIESFTDSSIVLYHEKDKLISIDTMLVFGNDTLHISETDTITSTVLDTIPFKGEVIYNKLNQVLFREELDISGNLYIRNLEPLRQLDKLRKLNISNTLVDDLFPLRNLTKLEYLDISGTAVTNLDPLVYTTSMRSLFLNSTRVPSLDVINNFTSLEILHLNNTPVDSLDAIRNLSTIRDLRFADSRINELGALSGMIKLELLNLSGTKVQSLEPIQFLTTLERIFIERTAISTPEYLTRLNNLRVIYADNSELESLAGLEDLASLEKIYCDGARIGAEAAQAFMSSNPEVLIIYESERLHKWWQELPLSWQDVFRGYVEMDSPPTKEELHKVTLITELDLSGNTDINTLEPVSKLPSLKIIDAAGTSIERLEGIQDLVDLQELNISGTRVGELAHVSSLTRLNTLNIAETRVASIEPVGNLSQLHTLNMETTTVDELESLYYITDLALVYCDGSLVTTSDVDGLHALNPDCLVVWQTANLKAWWGTLDEPWKKALRLEVEVDDEPTKEQLHSMVFLQELKIPQAIELRDLDPVPQLRYLEILDVSEGKIQSLAPLSESKYIRNLIVTGNPVNDLKPLSNLKTLIHLDISNSPVDDLDALASLENLEYLNCSGTQIKKLDPLETLFNLQVLECHNTNVKSLDPLEGLFRLRHVKCYNTRINDRRVEQFREARPTVEVVYY